MGRLERKAVAAQMKEILSTGHYLAGGKQKEEVSLNRFGHGMKAWSKAVAYSPEKLAALLQGEGFKKLFTEAAAKGQDCHFLLTKHGSFASGLLEPCPEELPPKEQPVLVMNFANAHRPGGGFWNGALAQEESLCRESTLIASLESRTASAMYKYNHQYGGACDSHYMLLSPYVLVISDGKGVEPEHFFNAPKLAAVATVAAPNRKGRARLVPQPELDKEMKDRLRLMLAMAAVNGYKKLVLGAWGCGAFGNDPYKVAGFFKELFLEEQFALLFSEVEFAILGGGPNYDAFQAVFEGILSEGRAEKDHTPHKVRRKDWEALPMPEK